MLKNLAKTSYFFIKCFWNRVFINNLIVKKPYLHVGCGFEKLSQFINVDIRPTRATDLINDCSHFDIFPNNSFSVIYSNAFFEHLFYRERPVHLANLYRILKKRGTVIYLGIPDFEMSAKLYLKKQFNLDQVYQYTHGDPEQVADEYWLHQLHKTLFDKKTINKLLLDAGFKSFCIFRYCFRQEKHAICLGFIAFKGKPSIGFSKKEIDGFIKQYTQDVSTKNLLIL